MPLPLSRKGSPRVYLPGYKSMSTATFDRAVKSFSAGGVTPPRYGEFEQGQMAKIEDARAELNANQLISLGIKQPAYALEAPLRPLNVATGGLVGGVAKGVEDVVGKIPVVSNILGGLGEGLRFLDNVGASLPNQGTASLLANLIGKTDDFVLPEIKSGTGTKPSPYRTAGEFRRAIASQWGTDNKGNQYTLAELEARAKNNVWDFGQFATDADAGTDMLMRLITNPLNLLILPGIASAAVRLAGSGIKLASGAAEATRISAGTRYLAGAMKASNWARPIIKPGTLVGSPHRYGYGYARTMGRGIAKAYSEAHNPNPFQVQFLDVNASARAVLNGAVREQGTMKSLTQALAWGLQGAKSVSRKVYFPGLNTELKGARLAGAASRAWMRGGIQQELALGGAEALFGGVDNYLTENDMDHNVVGDVSGAIHDALSTINNDHPISDSNAFVMAALLMPWSKAGREIVAEPGKAFRKKVSVPMYTDNVASNLRVRMNSKLGTAFKKNDEMFTTLGNGDIERGKAIFEYEVDRAEILKAKNQFTHLFQQVGSAEIDGFAARAQFFGDNVRVNIERRRISGALQPGSTADYMLERSLQPGAVPKGKVELASEVSSTSDSFIATMQNRYDTYLAIGPELEALGLDIVEGGMLSREIMEALIEQTRRTASELIDPIAARQILDVGPSLVYENEFWREFSVTLGQKPHGGTYGKTKTSAEAVSKDELIAEMEKIRDGVDGVGGLASEQELFHETLRASRAQGVAKTDVFRIKEPPYPLGAKVKANRLKATGRIEQLSDNERALHNMRTTEFFKSGKPKFGAASEIAGTEGGVFKRVEVKTAPPVDRGEAMPGTIKTMPPTRTSATYLRDDDVAIRVDKGVVNILVPAERRATLMAELNETLFKSGPRKGSIKPGMEAESQRINNQIEAANVGIDTEALVLAAQNNGRIIVADRAAGQMLADYGFVESAKVRGTEQAAYSYRGGDPSKIIANRDAKAFSEYRPTAREASEKGAIGVARRDAINASMFTPSTEYLGKALDSAKTMFPEERLRFINERQAATTKAYKNELADISEMDNISFDMMLFDKRIDEMTMGEWADGLSTKEYAKVRDFFRDKFVNYPNLNLVRREPGLVVDPAQSRFSTLVTHRNRLQTIFADYGPLSPIQRVYDALFSPVHVRWLGKQTQTEVHNLLATEGVEPAASRKFIDKARERVLESRSVKGVASVTGSHTYRSIEALPEETLRAILQDVAPLQATAVVERWGSVQKMLTEASNRLLRDVQRKYRMGGKVNALEAAADASFRFYQYAPGFEKLSFAGQRFTKFTYPWWRFHSDPFFHLMNYTEPSVYAVLNNGWRGLKKADPAIERRVELSSAGLIPPGGLYAKDVSADLLMADPGVYTTPHNIRPRFEREYELTTNQRAEQLFEAMSKEHPVARMMRERFGDNVADWSTEMNRLMENLVKRGPEQTVRAEWKATLEGELGYSLAELKQLAPVAERLTEVYRGVHNQLTDLYIGRMSRSNIERLANTYFLAFPISYMIKVMGWAYKILFEKLGPINGSTGAYLWDQYRQKYETLMENDPGFKAWTEDNRDFLFALEMTVPITPSSIGVGLNKSTRYAGSWISPELFGDYGVEPGDITSVIEGGTRFGPIRSWNLAKRMLSSWEVPGFYKEKRNTPQPLLP